jgi:hypothetical protein
MPRKLNAVRAAFKAGVKPTQIARQFGISQADVRKALANDGSKANNWANGARLGLSTSMKELLDYLGLPGSIATVFLAIMFAFVQIEKLATTTAKSDLSHFLKTANWITISSQLPKIIH